MSVLRTKIESFFRPRPEEENQQESFPGPETHLNWREVAAVAKKKRKEQK